MENQRNIFTVIAREGEKEKAEMFYGSGLRGKIKEKRGMNARCRLSFSKSSLSLSLSLSCYSRKQKLNNREVIWPNWIVWRDKVQLIPGNCHEHEASSRYRNVGTSKRVRVD